MLVAFALTNSSCFRDRQELSMEAVGGTGGAFAFDSGVRYAPRLNRVAAIYGPNGSGKSRLVDGLTFAQHFVLDSSKGRQAGEKIPCDPFLFREDTRKSPSTFDVAFVEGGTLYEYGFAVDSERVHQEWLLACPPGGRMRRLLDRSFDADTREEHWKFGPSVRGSKQLWRENTRPDALLVSTAAQLNSETFGPVVDWFGRLRVLGTEGPPPIYTAKAINENDRMKRSVLMLMKEADITVADVAVDEASDSLEELKDELPPKVFARTIKHSPTFDWPRVGFVHEPRDSDSQRIDLERESDGTQRYFSLAFPWLEVLANNRVLVVDELDRSLHPLLVASLIQRFNREPEDSSSSHAQLIATMHDVTLLQETLDRGQVWFTEKDRQTEAASLIALSDYRPRKNEALMRGYLGGRYGAIPVVVPPDALD